MHHLDASVEVSTHSVEFVDKDESRHTVLIRLPPNCLGLGLYTRDTVEHGDRTIQHPQAPLHLNGEVDVPRSVDDVDLTLPSAPSHDRSTRKWSPPK
jgi:hypothetical protein